MKKHIINCEMFFWLSTPPVPSVHLDGAVAQIGTIADGRS